MVSGDVEFKFRVNKSSLLVDRKHIDAHRLMSQSLASCWSLMSGAGNIRAQACEALEEQVRPAPDSNGVDVTDEMVAQVNGYYKR